MRKTSPRLLFYCIIALITCFAYWCAYLPPNRYEGVGFVAMTIPFWLLVNSVIIVWSILTRQFLRAIPSLFCLIVGFQFVRATYAFPFLAEKKQKADFTLINYNVHSWDAHSRLPKQDKELIRKQMSRGVAMQDADIVCFQEYLEGYMRTDITRLMRKNGFKYDFFSPSLSGWTRERGGMIIFSKYPIVGTKAFRRKKLDANQILYSDILTPKGVIRVFNVHLQSNRISEAYFDPDQKSTQVKRSIYLVVKKVGWALAQRAEQITLLEREIKASPFPVIVCGDFNDTPYSYGYTRMQRLLKNSFEVAGSGTGFTFNGFLPFLRIDHQFADKRLKAQSFTTLYHLNHSDHFPVKVSYSFK